MSLIIWGVSSFLFSLCYNTSSLLYYVHFRETFTFSGHFTLDHNNNYNSAS